MSDQAVEVTAGQRSLPTVLRDALNTSGVELIHAEVVAVPSRARVVVEVNGEQITVPKLASFAALPGQAAYLLSDGQQVIAAGTVTLQPDPPPSSLTVNGPISGQSLTVWGGVTAAGLQVNGSATVIGNLAAGAISGASLNVGGGQITGGGLNVGGGSVTCGGLTASGGATVANLTTGGNVNAGNVYANSGTVQGAGVRTYNGMLQANANGVMFNLPGSAPRGPWNGGTSPGIGAVVDCLRAFGLLL